MKASEALIVWNRGEPGKPSAEVKVGPLSCEGEAGWSRPYRMSGGAADIATRKRKGKENALMAFIEFNTLVVRDYVDPQAAHREFLKIDEYAERVSPEIARKQ